MLGLREQVCRDKRGVGSPIRHNENFTRARDHINGNRAKDLLFGLRHKGIAGANDLIHTRHALGAVGERGNGLRTTDLEDAVDACNLRGRKNDGVDLAVSAGRCDHYDLAASRNFGWDRVHEHSRGVGRRATGHIEACAVNGDDLLTHHHAVFLVEDKAVAHLALVEATDVGGRLL